ncbi:hypothetical protein Tsubulata_015731 [Turnera subulata]|uniref:Uncharacterized protein n=1 Tax=Turnera subulata TaxID=218843 RepID=A0A9Q0JH42_9ROSI|nr:hypothetical protein Tsubulata_015731 [Turnera subulata]
MHGDAEPEPDLEPHHQPGLPPPSSLPTQDPLHAPLLRYRSPPSRGPPGAPGGSQVEACEETQGFVRFVAAT